MSLDERFDDLQNGIISIHKDINKNGQNIEIMKAQCTSCRKYNEEKYAWLYTELTEVKNNINSLDKRLETNEDNVNYIFNTFKITTKATIIMSSLIGFFTKYKKEVAGALKSFFS